MFLGQQASIGCRGEKTIVIHRAKFVNRRLGFVLGFAACIVSFEQGVWSQDTEYYLQAVERLGPASKLVWSEPGDNSLDRWRSRSLIDVQGVVVSWEIDKLVLIKPDSKGPTNFPGDLVVGIEPNWKAEPYAQVHQLFVQRNFRQVLQKGQTALGLSEIPKWQQRLLVSEMVDSAAAIEQFSVAARIFKVLAEDPCPELLMSRIPLPWSDEWNRLTPAWTQEVFELMSSQTPSMRLLGASWSLGGPHRLEAIEVLKSLAKSDTAWIAAYSTIQLWRLSLPEEILSARIEEWIAQRDELPVPLQAGPTMLLAHRLEQANQPKLAIAQWLRVASMHQDRYHLAEQAMGKGIDAARKLGDDQLAKNIASRFSVVSGAVKP